MSIKARFWQAVVPAACISLMLAGSALARQAVLKLDDGREITGELVRENTQEVVLDIAGIHTTFPRDRVSSLAYVKSIAEQYQERRSQVADDDLDQRYELTRWLFENKAYDLAKRDLADLIVRFPKDGRLVPLQNLIDARIKLMEDEGSHSAAPKSSGASSGDSKETPATSPAGEAGDFDRNAPAPRMTEEQINLLRVYEINPSSRPNVSVPNEVMEEIYRRYAGEPGVPVGASAQRDALGWPGWRKLNLLFQLRARDLYSKVQVHTEPQSVHTFRTQINNRYLLTYCATTNCHGGKDAGNFFAFRFEPASNATVYSNYYILHKYNTDRGYMIDRERPERSFLLQYGLPRNVAALPHPDVPGWRPLFNNARDGRAVQIAQWVRSLGVSSVDYPVSYTIPTMPSAKAATTQPAAETPSSPAKPAGNP